MPELDTYKSIERYAKDPRDPTSQLAFNALFTRVENIVNFNALKFGGLDAFDVSKKLYIGAIGGRTEKKTAKTEESPLSNFMSLTPSEQLDAFKKMCVCQNVDFDQTTLIKESTSETSK